MITPVLCFVCCCCCCCGCWLLVVGCWLVFVVCSFFFVLCSLFFVICSLFFVVSCLLFVVFVVVVVACCFMLFHVVSEFTCIVLFSLCLFFPFFSVSSLGWLSSLSFTVAGRLTRIRGPPVGTCNCCCIEQNCFIGTWCFYLKDIHVLVFHMINDVYVSNYTHCIFCTYVYICLYTYIYIYIWYMYIIYMYVHVNCMIEQLPIVWYHDIMRYNLAYLCYIYALNQMNLIMFKTSCKLPRYLIQQNLRFSLKRKNCRFFAHCWACGPSDQWVLVFGLTPYVWSFPLVACEWNVHVLPSDCRICDCTMVCLKCTSVFTYQYIIIIIVVIIIIVDYAMRFIKPPWWTYLEVAGYEIPRPQWASDVPANLLRAMIVYGNHPLARQKSKETPSNGRFLRETRDTLYLRV